MSAVYIQMHKTTFIMEENTMNPDKTAPEEQSDLGSYCLQYRTPMHIIIRSKHTTSVMDGRETG